METHTFIEFEKPEALVFADLTGILYDLENTHSLANELKRILEGETPDWALVDAFTTAILVRYSRPFASGIRKKLRTEVPNELSEHQCHKHERLQDFRDKHIARSVNAFEANQPVAHYVEERVDIEDMCSIECQHSRVMGLSLVELDDVIELTTAIFLYVDHVLEIEKKKILAAVRSIPF